MSFWANNPFPQMGQGHQGLGSMDLEAELEVQKAVRRRLEESARAGFVAYVNMAREHTMLVTRNQKMLAQEAPKEKFVDDFMVFLGAIDNGDLLTLQRFNEKDMMNTISKMRNSNAGHHGGLECFYGLGDVVSKIGLGLEEKAAMDTILATVEIDGSSGVGNGGFSGEYGDDYPKTKLGFEVKNKGGKSEFADDYEPELEGAMVDAIEKRNSEAPANMVAAVNETGAN